ncbi:MAG TPA: hypothetical protein VHM30_07545 [Gemmatimonadaceae bacterium]|nr:hypothetical protein [Gemmatimonadaceae bacterium]
MNDAAPLRTPGGGLWVLRLLVVAAALAPLLSTSGLRSAVPEDIRAESGLFWVLCWVPAFAYLMQSSDTRPPIPFLAIIGVAHGLYYALQLTAGVDNANQVQTITLAPLDPRHEYARPVRIALLGWSALLAAYYCCRPFLRPRPLRVVERLPASVLRTWGVRLLLGGVFFDFMRQALPVPLVLRGALNFAAMLAQFGMTILIVLNMRGYLERWHRIVLGAGLLAILLLAIGTGSIASAVFAALTALLAMWIGAPRVRVWWVVTGAVAAALFVSLRGVAMDYREVAWFTNEELPVTQRSQVILGILAQRVERDGVDGAVKHGWETVSTRSANMDLLADVVRRTPRDVPYWNGETYLSLVGMAVPRVIWPNKPVKQLGQTFGHRYEYLGDWDRSTSINLPFLIEFYCNFGTMGVVVGMLLVGIIYALLEQRLNTPRQGALLSLCALVLLVPLINIESDFSLVFGGLLLNGVALWAVLAYIARAARAGSAQSVVGARAGGLGVAAR